MQPLYETSLQVIVDTNKEVYNLGETINFTICIINNKSYAIGIRPPADLSTSILNETGQVEQRHDIQIQWKAYTSIIVLPHSEHRFNGHPFEDTFKPKSMGTYRIHVELDGKLANATIVIS